MKFLKRGSFVSVTSLICNSRLGKLLTSFLTVKITFETYTNTFIKTIDREKTKFAEELGSKRSYINDKRRPQQWKEEVIFCWL